MNLDEDIDLALEFQHDPRGWVQAAYPWGEKGSPLERQEGPREWQGDILDEIGTHLQNSETRQVPLRIAIASGHGIGKALRPDDFVPTPTGFVQVRDVKAGDMLFGESGSAVRVLAVQKYEACPFYCVKFSDGTSVDVSSGHLWKVRGRQDRRAGRDWQTMETSTLR